MRCFTIYCFTNHHFQEETDWEGGSNDADDSDDDDDDDEEIKAGTSGLRPAREVFPVLAPPEQFQNCLSPSATYEVRIDESSAPSETSDQISYISYFLRARAD